VAKAAKSKRAEIQTILDTLSPEFPNTKAYRYNPASIRIRIIDKRFRGLNKVEREELVLPFLDTLPEEILQDVMILLLLAPSETAKSLMNLEFENPTPPQL
jgi:hypothetical protein